MTPTQAGVSYCVTHDGIANEDESVCDFLEGADRHPCPCDLRPLFYEESE